MDSVVGEGRGCGQVYHSAEGVNSDLVPKGCDYGGLTGAQEDADEGPGADWPRGLGDNLRGYQYGVFFAAAHLPKWRGMSSLARRLK